MTFNDIFKSNFLENVTGVSIFDTLTALFTNRSRKMPIKRLPITAKGIRPAARTMPTAMDQNKKAISRGSFIAVRKRTIDRAPTIPRESTTLDVTARITSDHESELKALAFLKEKVKRVVVKSKTARKGAIELNLDIRLKEDNTDFINTLSEMDGINSAVLVSYNGDYMG